jgi:hypothetical protein
MDHRRASLLVCTIMMAGGIGAAIAAVPSDPDNIIAFPNRDFVSVSGYQNRIGEELLMTVERKGVVIGSAKPTVKKGDPAFEINHPGGYCWGAGTDLKVTPDILPGDIVRLVNVNGSLSEDVTVMSPAVTETVKTKPDTVVITGTIQDPIDVDPANIEQRVVNPDLTPLASIARRDIRAVLGSLTPNAKGDYSSSLVVSGTTFTATYVFGPAAVADGVPDVVADGGGERLLSWMTVDAAGNRQGITIAEKGELGGPGLGGCPLGPADGPPPAGSMQVGVSGSSAIFGWTPTTAGAGAPAVTGYFVGAFDKDPLKDGAVRRVGADETAATLTINTASTYDFEVRSMTGGPTDFKYGPPFTVSKPAQSAPPVTTNPPRTPSPLTVEVLADGKIKITSPDTPAPTEIYYKFDTSANDAEFTTVGVTKYVDAFFPPAGLADGTTMHYVNWVVYNIEGGYLGSGARTPPGFIFKTAGPPTTRKPVTDLTGTGGQRQITAHWGYPTTGDADLTGFNIEYMQMVIGGNADPVAWPKTVAKTERLLVITPLAVGASYRFRVTPQPGDVPSAWSDPVTVDAAEAITLSKPTWRAQDFRVSVTAPSNNNLIKLFLSDAEPDYTNTTGLIATIQVNDPAMLQPVPATVPVTFVDDVRLVKGATPAFKKTIYAWWADGAGKARIDVTNLDAAGGGGGGKGRRMLSQ